MNKTDFIEVLSQEMDRPKVVIKDFSTTFLQVATKELSKEDGEIVFQGFGVFSIWDQVERPGRNPKTGKPCLIRARKSIKFKPSRFLIRGLNKR